MSVCSCCETKLEKQTNILTLLYETRSLQKNEQTDILTCQSNSIDGANTVARRCQQSAGGEGLWPSPLFSFSPLFEPPPIFAAPRRNGIGPPGLPSEAERLIRLIEKRGGPKSGDKEGRAKILHSKKIL
jgi:hypothetical protein